MLSRREQPPRPLVAEFAVVNARGDAGLVHRLDKGFVELVIVHQPAVADSAVENLDVRPVADPVALRVHVFPVQHGCPLSLTRHRPGKAPFIPRSPGVPMPGSGSIGHGDGDAWKDGRINVRFDPEVSPGHV